MSVYFGVSLRVKKHNNSKIEDREKRWKFTCLTKFANDNHHPQYQNNTFLKNKERKMRGGLNSSIVLNLTIKC